MEIKTEDKITKILKNEHKLVRKNLEKILKAEQPMFDLYLQTVTAIDKHFRGEEALLFSKFENNPKARRLIMGLKKEHDYGRQLICENNSISATAETENWLANVKVLDDLVSSHFKVEEDDVFPMVDDALSKAEEKELARRYLVAEAQTGA
jgi:hemerythrin-like domain-containing protein